MFSLNEISSRLTLYKHDEKEKSKAIGVPTEDVHVVAVCEWEFSVTNFCFDQGWLLLPMSLIQ